MIAIHRNYKSFVTLFFILLLSFSTYASSLDSSRVYYDKDNYYKSSWQWLDINNDGLYECYYFNIFGHMYKNSKTPDGYYVNNEGQWVENGQVQYKTIYEVQSYLNNLHHKKYDTKIDEIKTEFSDTLDDLIVERTTEANNYIASKMIDKKLLFDLQGYYIKLMDDMYNIYYKELIKLCDENTISKDDLKNVKAEIASISKDKEKELKTRLNSISVSITWQLEPEEYKDNKKDIIK